MVFLELLFALTVTEMLVTQYLIVPAVSIGATAAGIYAPIRGIQEYEKEDHGFWHSIGEGIEETWDAFASLFDKRGEPLPDLGGVDAAVWFFDTGLKGQDLEVLRGMRIQPVEGEDGVGTGKAFFQKGEVAVEGSFMGTEKPHVDGVRSGNFSAIYPGITAMLEGNWIVVNRTEASAETAAKFETLRSSFSSGQAKDDANRMKLFEQLMNTAAENQREEDEGAYPLPWDPGHKRSAIYSAETAVDV